MVLYDAFPLFILSIELRALNVVGSRLIAAPTLPVTIFFAHTALEELVLHAVGGASSSLESVALLAGSAVVGEGAVGAFGRASEGYLD